MKAQLTDAQAWPWEPARDHGSNKGPETAGKNKTRYDKPVKTRAWKRSHLGKVLATKECHPDCYKDRKRTGINVWLLFSSVPCFTGVSGWPNGKGLGIM